MRTAASNNLLLGLFALLAAGSVGLKAAAGPPKDGLGDARPGQVEDFVAASLRSQGFATRVQEWSARSATVLGKRGGCQISARDARAGAAYVAIFADDAKAIGPVRYLYRHGSYVSPPTMRMRLGRLEAEILGRLGIGSKAHVPIALAASPACGDATFNLEDVTVAT